MSDEVERLVREGTPVLYSIARRIARRLGGHVPLDDLIALGRPALFEVAQRYDPERAKFSTYAALKIKWAILDGIRRDTHGRSAFARALALAAAERVGEASEGPPSGGVGTEQDYQERLRRLLEERAAALAVGLVAAETMADPSADPEETAARKQIAGVLRGAVAELPERERALVERHYYGGEAFDGIAEDLGISKSWASRLHAQAITRLAKVMRRKPAKVRREPNASSDPSAA